MLTSSRVCAQATEASVGLPVVDLINGIRKLWRWPDGDGRLGIAVSQVAQSDVRGGNADDPLRQFREDAPLHSRADRRDKGGHV